MIQVDTDAYLGIHVPRLQQYSQHGVSLPDALDQYATSIEIGAGGDGIDSSSQRIREQAHLLRTGAITEESFWGNFPIEP